MSCTAELLFNMHGPAHQRDPHASWAMLRATDPVHLYPPLGYTLVTRHADVSRLLRDRTVANYPIAMQLLRIADRAGRQIPVITAFLGATLPVDSSPGHPAARRRFAAVMNNRPIAAIAPFVEQLNARLLATGRAAGGFDLVTDYTDRLTMRVMTFILGMDDEDADYLTPRVRPLPLLLNLAPDWRRVEQLEPLMAEAEALIVQRLGERRRAPREDGLTRLIAVSAEHGITEDRDIAVQVMFLLFAGFAATGAFLTGAIVRILRDPSIRGAILDPEQMPAAAEELMRLESTARYSSPRLANADTVVGSRPMPENRIMIPLLESANYDEDAYDEPHLFRPSRPPPTPMSFGDGPHACLGVMIARLEARTVLPAVAALHDMSLLAQDHEMERFDAVRRLKQAEVTFGA